VCNCVQNPGTRPLPFSKIIADGITGGNCHCTRRVIIGASICGVGGASLVMNVVSHRVHQLAHAFRELLRVDIQRRRDGGMAQVRLHVFRVPVALSVRRECAPQDLEVHRYRDAEPRGDWLYATTQPVFRPHRRRMLARENQRFRRRSRILFLPHLQRGNEHIRQRNT